MSMLNLEQFLVERLGLVDGLIVRTTADTSEVQLKALGTKPTAVVAFLSADVKDSKTRAILMEQRWSVYYVRRGALSERDAIDGVQLEQIVRTLHGWTPDDDLFGALKLESVNTDYRENAREYFITFAVQTHLTL